MPKQLEHFEVKTGNFVFIAAVTQTTCKNHQNTVLID
jgi:hypothetical protein